MFRSPRKLLGHLAGWTREGGKSGTRQRRVAHVTDAMMLDLAGQQADPLGVAAANKIAEPAADQHAVEIARSQSRPPQQDDDARANRAAEPTATRESRAA